MRLYLNHINKITAKANRVLGFISRNLHSCPRNLRATAFQTLVRPHLEYCSTVWNPHTNELVEKIESIQRRGARFVFKDYRRTSSVTTMLNKLNWIPLRQRRKIARLTMIHKVINGQVAIPAHTFVQPATTRKSYRHNHKNQIKRMCGKSDYYNQSFFPLTIQEWNQLPQDLVNITETGTFKAAVADYITSTAQSTQD